MFKESTLSIYGGKPYPQMTVPATSTAVFMPFTSRQWITNVRGTTDWKQLGNSTTYPANAQYYALLKPYYSTPDRLASVAGNGTFFVSNAVQISDLNRVLGYYIKANTPMTPVTLTGTQANGGFGSLEILSMAFNPANNVYIAAGNQIGTTSSGVRAFRSLDAINWTVIDLGGFATSHDTNNWIVFNNGSFFLSYENSVTPPFSTVMLKSVDGITWTTFNAPNATSSSWKISAMNNLLFAVGDNNTFYVSSNTSGAITWTQRTQTGILPAGNAPILPQYYVNSTYFYMPEALIDSYYTSPNGYNWTPHTNTQDLWRATVFGTNFMAVDSLGLNIYRSADGINWTLNEVAIIAPDGIASEVTALHYGSLS